MARLYAEDTRVPLSQTRGEIDRLLRGWNCDGIQWTDEHVRGRVTLRFLWTRQSVTYVARFAIAIPTDAEIQKSGLSPSKVEKALRDRGKREHRLLLLWLKAAFNAIEGGIIPAELLFLPWLEGRDGQTVGEKALPRLQQLLVAHSADALLLGDK